MAVCLCSSKALLQSAPKSFIKSFMIPALQNVKLICKNRQTPWFVIFNIWSSLDPSLEASGVDNFKNVPYTQALSLSL